MEGFLNNLEKNLNYKELNYKVNGSNIVVNGVSIDFNCYIDEVLLINDVLIIRLNDTSKVSNEFEPQENNVYAINSYGEILWRINLETALDSSYYTGIKPAVVVNTFAGERLVLNSNTGERMLFRQEGRLW